VSGMSQNASSISESMIYPADLNGTEASSTTDSLSRILMVETDPDTVLFRHMYDCVAIP
jgi:hypothetical protein